MIRISETLRPACLRVPLSADTKRGVIEELVDALVAAGLVSDRERTVRAVWERETMRTTGIGNGVAIPHGRCAAAGEIVLAVGIAPRGVDFDSIDHQPAHVIVLLISPAEKTGAHIQALARISRLLSNDAFRKRLSALTNPEEVCRAFAEQEGDLLVG